MSAVSIGSVHDGESDLRIPQLVAVVEDYRIYCDGSWILELAVGLRSPILCSAFVQSVISYKWQDSTGFISGFVSARDAKQVSGLFCRGASILLENVSERLHENLLAIVNNADHLYYYPTTISTTTTTTTCRCLCS